MIRKHKEEYTLYSHKGKKLGTYKSKKKTEEREKEVKMFKHMKKK